jgi:hypothetical protein
MRSIVVLATAVLLTACASQPATETSSSQQPATPSAKSEPAQGNVRTVKSIDGSFEGEIIGTIRPNSRFSKLKIGMTMSQVHALIKVPDDMTRHETGKRWIPFYFGDDAQRLEVLYKGDGCLTYTGGNVYGGGGDQLIAITADSTGSCFNS